MSEAAVIEPVEAWLRPPPTSGSARASRASAVAPPAVRPFLNPQDPERDVHNAGTHPAGEGTGRPARGRVCSANPANSVLVLGLGNDILTDDAIGLRLVRALAQRLDPAEGITVLETEEMGLSLLDHIVGYEQLVIVDAIQTGTAPAGCLHQFDGQALPSRRTGAPHFLGVGDTLALGRLLDLSMPARVTVFAIEVADPFTLGTELSTNLKQLFHDLVTQVLEGVRRSRAA